MSIAELHDKINSFHNNTRKSGLYMVLVVLAGFIGLAGVGEMAYLISKLDRKASIEVRCDPEQLKALNIESRPVSASTSTLKTTKTSKPSIIKATSTPKNTSKKTKNATSTKNIK